MSAVITTIIVHYFMTLTKTAATGLFLLLYMSATAIATEVNAAAQLLLFTIIDAENTFDEIYTATSTGWMTSINTTATTTATTPTTAASFCS